MGSGPTAERLTLHWVEVADERGRARMEMRWAVEAPAASLPVDPAEVVPASATPPPVSPAA